jgi:hypothetical protein
LPTPKLSDDTHGTRCAGQIAAGKNTACGVGIAYNSKVAGVRILSGKITDIDEAAALNYGFQNVSIYSCSWGPPDTGTVMEGPDYLIDKAVLHGINAGRGGKGSIFVFARWVYIRLYYKHQMLIPVWQRKWCRFWRPVQFRRVHEQHLLGDRLRRRPQRLAPLLL